MAEIHTVYVNGRAIAVPEGSTAAVAVLMAGIVCRTSVSGEPRVPFCGIGTCFECRVVAPLLVCCRLVQSETVAVVGSRWLALGSCLRRV